MLPPKNSNSEVVTHYQRNQILDFVKGMLIYSMIIYHTAYNFSENYQPVLMVTSYVSGAFIYITGFLVGYYYLCSYAHNIGRIRKRLFMRGFKIALLFLLLNINLFVNEGRQGDGNMLQRIFVKYIVLGTGEAHFEILLPIGYVLLFSAFTVSLLKNIQAENNKALILNFLLAVIVLISDAGLFSASTNYYFFIIGLFGLSNSLIVHNIKNTQSLKLITAFLVIGILWLRLHFVFGSILFIYTLYVISVLATIYNVGEMINLTSGIAHWTVKIGRHTLFSYIYHVFLIVGLSRIYPIKMTFSGNVFIVFIIGSIVILSVMLLDKLRHANRFIDRSYSFIFR